MPSHETFGKEQKSLGKDLPGPSISSKQASSYTVNKAGTESFALLKQQFQRGFGDICWDRDMGGAIKMFKGLVAGFFALLIDEFLD